MARAVLEDARGHGVEADGLLLALGQYQIGDGARKATIAVVEWMQGYEPEVCYAGPQKGIEASLAAADLEPGEKVSQLRFQPRLGRGFEMYGRLVNPT